MHCLADHDRLTCTQQRQGVEKPTKVVAYRASDMTSVVTIGQTESKQRSALRQDRRIDLRWTLANYHRPNTILASLPNDSLHGVCGGSAVARTNVGVGLLKHDKKRSLASSLSQLSTPEKGVVHDAQKDAN
jgi:hypothetical protein